MTTTTAPDLTLARVFNAPRALVYRAFTDPGQFALWWGPVGNFLPQDEVEFDIRAGGHMAWTELFPADPGTWTKGRVDLTEVVEGELLDGTMKIVGQLPHGFQPFETRMRLEFFDDADGRTRVEVRQWLPQDLVAPTHNGWGEAYSKLDAVLARAS